jgi:hypothetical protein
MLNSLKMKLKRSNSGVSPSAGSSSAGSSSSAGAPPTVATSASPAASAGSAGAVGGAGAAAGHGHAPASPTATAAAAALEASVPRADLALPHPAAKRERRRSSIARDPDGRAVGAGGPAAGASAGGGGGGASLSAAAALEPLPALKDAPLAKREALFKQKLALCCVTDFVWEEPEPAPAAGSAGAAAAAGNRRGKEVKRATLLELVDYVNTPGGQKILTEAVYGDVMAMVAANIFRALPPATGGVGPNGEEVTGGGGGEGGGGEDEEPFLEPAWPHLQLVYELLLRFVVSPEVKVKAAKKQVDTVFCAKLVELFDSEDSRERDYLKVRAG